MSYPWTAAKTWVTGEILTATDQNNITTTAINNSIPSSINDFSANVTEMQTTADPYPGSVASLATTLAEEISRLRYQILKLNQAIKGSSTTNWYEAPPAADVLKIGAAALAANLPMGGFKLSGLGTGSTAGDSVRYEDVTRLADVQTISGQKTFSIEPIMSATTSSTPTKNGIYANNVIKGWIRFNGTGTISVDDKFNVSSITDNGVGDYTINWDRDFADSNYCCLVTCLYPAFPTINNTGALTAGASRLFIQNSAGAGVDVSLICVMAIGLQ